MSTFPFIAVLAPQGSGNTVAVVFRHTGLIDSDTLVRELLHRKEAAQQISSLLHTQKQTEDQTRNHARALREQQDMEYEESLLMDQGLKEARAREEAEMAEMLLMSAEQEEKAEAERQRVAREEEEKAQAAERARLAKLAALPAEPEATADGVVNLSMRLPSARTQTRRFLDADTVGTVRQYLSSLEDMAQYGDHFRLLSNFPRKVHEDTQATLKSLNLGKKIQLIVESTLPEEEADGAQ